MAFVAEYALRICLIAQKNKKTNPRANACAENKQKNFFETKGDFGPMKTKGFTLVELLVVIAILAILATVSVVGYTSFINNAHTSAAESELAQIKTQIIAQDISGTYANDFALTDDGIVWNVGDVEKDAATIAAAITTFVPELEENGTISVTGAASQDGKTFVITAVTYNRTAGGSATWTIVDAD